MTAVAQNARFLVAFTEELKCIAEHLWPCTKGRVYIQPQGVWTNPDTGFAWRSHLRSSGVPADTSSLLFLLVCGIRQVKDPLYLTDTFSEWHNEDSRVHLIIIGPEMDSVLSAAVKERIKMARGVWLLPELPQNHLHAAMSGSFCLVNSSLSEGMSGAILEAMQLGLPVIARDIPGNAALITHEETGLLYTTAQTRDTTLRGRSRGFISPRRWMKDSASHCHLSQHCDVLIRSTLALKLSRVHVISPWALQHNVKPFGHSDTLQEVGSYLLIGESNLASGHFNNLSRLHLQNCKFCVPLLMSEN
ncbi:glycosyltransferase 1 domain-containing protein 1 isoform X4 [Lampetra planeri]